jgi:hypothetical protein
VTSPREQLIHPLRAWIADDARGRLARARGDRDVPGPAVAERHAVLRGPRGRELFERSRESGALEEEELRAAASVLARAIAAPGWTRARDRLSTALAERVPHDSDHHPATTLFERLSLEAHTARRRAFGRSLEAFAPRLVRARAEGQAEIEEAEDAAAWLRDVPAPADRADPAALLEASQTILTNTEDLFAELLQRAAHAAKIPVESWADLVHVLRAPAFGAALDPKRRWRRIAALLAPLGVESALAKRGRVERASPEARTRARVIALEVPLDVRIVPAPLELGLASERDAMGAIGRAAAIAWTHPALSPLLAMPHEGSAGRAIGALFAHLLAEPRFVERGLGLGAADAYALSTLALLHEIFELRTEAAAMIARRETARFEDAARTGIASAWRAEAPSALAAYVARPLHPYPLARLRAARWAAPLFVHLRDRFDEDFWRNPRAAEVLRAASERGGSVAFETVASELGIDATSTRYLELAG